MTLIYSVIESRHLTLRRMYEGKDMTGLTVREDLSKYCHMSYYNRRYDPFASDYNGDQGYFVYDDQLFNRKIFISRIQLGLSLPFHQDNGIKALFHLIEKSNNHEDYDRMDPSRRVWWIDNMQCTVLQMLDTEGNIVLFCKNGRTRSPMYLVAYLIIVHAMSVHKAMDIVADLLQQQRGQILDRFESLAWCPL